MLRKAKQHSMNITHGMDMAYRDLFNTPLGQKVLGDLELKFNPEKLHTDNPHTTAIRVGQSVPIRHILRRIKDGMDGKSTR
jgi:hypothetical protein